MNAGVRALLITVLGAASVGCAQLLGLDDTELRDDGGAGGDGGSAGLTVTAPASVRVVRGGDPQEVAVEIARSDGFAGAVTIDAVGLPAGVIATPIEIAAGQTEGVLAVSAAAGGTLGPISIQVAASAVDDAAVADDADVVLMVADPPGTLDATFNNDGITTLMLAGATDRIEAMVLQSTGRIVVLVTSGTNFSLAAFTPDGSLDTTFGSSGATAITGMTPKDLALRDNDKLVVVGINSGNTQLSLRGFNADGSLDDVFGTAGTTTLSPASFSASDGESVAVAADGRIYAGGDINNVAGFPTVFRFAANGTFENHAVLGMANPPNTILAISVRDDGNIMLGGTSSHSPGQFFFARVTPELALDATFDGDGFRTIPGGGGTPCTILALARGPDGQIAAAGRSQGGLGRSEMFMLNSDGTTAYSSSDDYDGSPEFRGNAVGVQADGKIVVAVEGFGSINASGVAVARFDTAGLADTTFATDGAIQFVAEVQADPDRLLRALVIQPDGRIVAGGNLSSAGLFLFRVWD